MSIENVHLQAVQYFFSLALAQINKQIAEINYSKADTLWKMSQGRYNLGTIAEDEMLEMQLSWLNTEIAREEADMNLRDREIRLRSFLGFNENVKVELILPSEIPDFQVDPLEVLELAHINNPEMISQQLTLLNAQSSVAQAKAEKGLNANLTASFGTLIRILFFVRLIRMQTSSKQYGWEFLYLFLTGVLDAEDTKWHDQAFS
jgi:outer membrane protein TolC